jgi:hypothetical protein
LQELFKENRINLTKETISEMFNGSLFTLEKFKAINNSPRGLQNFKESLMPHLQRIYKEIVEED